MDAHENVSPAKDGGRGLMHLVSVRGSDKPCTFCHQPIAATDVEWRPSRLHSAHGAADELRFHQWCFEAWQRGTPHP
jgi:hypothetical protein